MKLIITESKLNDVTKSMVKNQGLDYAIKFFGNNIDRVVESYNGNPYEYLESFSNLRIHEGNKEMYFITESNRIIIKFYKKTLKSTYPQFTVSYIDFLKFFREGIRMFSDEYKPIILDWFNKTYDYNMMNFSEWGAVEFARHLNINN